MSSRPRRTNPGGEDVRTRFRRVRDRVEERIWPAVPARFGEYRMGAERATTRVRPPGGRSIDVAALDHPSSPRQYLWRLAFRGIYEARD